MAQLDQGIVIRVSVTLHLQSSVVIFPVYSVSKDNCQVCLSLNY